MQRSEAIARHVHEATRRPRLTKQAIAKKLGIARDTLDRRLAGESEWRYEEVVAIADMLGITVNQLIANDGDADINMPFYKEGK